MPENLNKLWDDYKKKKSQIYILDRECELTLKKIAKILCTCYHHDTDEWAWEYCSTRMSGKCSLFKQKEKIEKK